MIDRLSRKRERGAIRRKARARVPEKLKVFWEKEQPPEEAKPQEWQSREADCDVMFEKYTVRKAVISTRSTITTIAQGKKTLSIPKKF